ncbi:MAG: 30S ribosomal protein S18 [Chloroflexota bacterium]|nr:30S ribosomal protein S18 [Chloroflexota bacterium]
MSEQVNPTTEEDTLDAPPTEATSGETIEATVASDDTTNLVQVASMRVASYEFQAPPALEDVVRASAADDADDEADDDDDDVDHIVRGPGEYAPQERSGRSRRVGSDVRLRDISYKNIPLLARFLDGRGRILSRRKTRVSAKVQRNIVKSIKHARHLALLPYTADQTRIVRKRR